MSQKSNPPRATIRFLAVPVLVALALAAVAVPAAANHGGRQPAGSTPQPQRPAGGGLAALVGGLLGPTRPPAQSAAPAPRTPATPAPATPAPAAGATVSSVPTMQVGSSGELVKQVEQKLDSLKYFVGAVDGSFDEDTKQGVLAFQKVNGAERSGVVNTAVYNALQTAGAPAPLVSDGAAHRVEIDLGRQVLFLYEGGSLSKIIAVSSGTSDTPTPTGDYGIYHQSSGWETSALGRLYNSQYFIGGYAIHGSLSVPPWPASHGCVRLPMSAADWFPSHVKIGTPVHVR
jgi:peptidoglycan hydrolase-like protein with peptidoglycan-binding domain